MLHQSFKNINLLSIIAFTVTLLYGVIIFFHTDAAMEQDLGRHLTFGKIIWESKKIPDVNLFSYTHPDFPFINHHWGSEVIFFLVHNTFSVTGLIILKVLIVTITLGILLLFTIKLSSVPIFLFTATVSFELLKMRTQIRPEIFGYLCFSLFLIILTKAKKYPTKLVWLLPIIELVWVNLHITYIYGLFIYVAFIIDRLIQRKMEISYLLIGVTIFLSTLFNPFGLSGALYPFLMFKNYGYPIAENQSLLVLFEVLKTKTLFYFLFALIVLILITPFLFQKLLFWEIIISYGTGFLIFTAVRHLPFFALTFLLVASRSLTCLKDNIGSILSLGNRKKLSLFFFTGFTLLIVFQSTRITSNRYYRSDNRSERFGIGSTKGMKLAVDYFLMNGLTGPIFNNFDIGSYLIYRLYPEELVFVDGRPEAYPVSFFQQTYIPIQDNSSKWLEAEKKYNFQTVIFSHTDQTPWGKKFIRYIVNNPNWRLVYLDDTGIILRHSEVSNEMVKTNKNFIEKTGFDLLKKTQDQEVVVRLINFFNLVQAYELEQIARIKYEQVNNNSSLFLRSP